MSLTKTATTTIVNCPVVPAGSTATQRVGGGSSALMRGWYQGKVVNYFAFGEAPLTVGASGVPLSPIFVTFNVNPGQPGPINRLECSNSHALDFYYQRPGNRRRNHEFYPARFGILFSVIKESRRVVIDEVLAREARLRLVVSEHGTLNLPRVYSFFHYYFSVKPGCQNHRSFK